MWAIGFIAVVAACITAGPALAQPATWDQAKVTGLAKDLAAAGEAWWQALQDQPGGATVGSGDSQAFDQMTRESHLIQEQSAGLAGSLAGGKGRAETLDMYKSLKEMSDDMKVDEQRTSLEAPALAAWAKFAGVMKQLAPYYSAK
jgi:hypothetical protein